MNKKVISRLCVFFIGVPVVIALTLFEQMNHAAIHAFVTILAILAAGEFYHILGHNFKLQNKALVISLIAFIHLMMFSSAIFEFDTSYVDYTFIASILICLSAEVLFADSFENSNSKMASSVIMLTYTGFLFTFITRLTFLNSSTQLLIMFLTMVFFCDSFAWFFGVLFGKNNKGLIKASPNKSIAGFCGGIFGSVLSGVMCWYLWNDLFTGTSEKTVSIWVLAGLGFVMSFCSILGDLVESVFKRSADCKDSGSIIPGRGGVLDSIDSIVFTAPVFYFAVTHIYPSLIK